MLRKILLAVVLGVGCTAGESFADDETKPGTPKPTDKGKLANFDNAKFFEKLDADKDGKVTKEEFKTFRETMAEKIKDKVPGGVALLDKIYDGLFAKMDADKDDVITKEEFEKFKPTGNFDPEQLKKLKEKLAEKKKDK